MKTSNIILLTLIGLTILGVLIYEPYIVYILFILLLIVAANYRQSESVLFKELVYCLYLDYSGSNDLFKKEIINQLDKLIKLNRNADEETKLINIRDNFILFYEHIPNTLFAILKSSKFKQCDYNQLICMLREHSTNPIESPELRYNLLAVKQEILKYSNGSKRPKHYGDRMFGYLIKWGYIKTCSAEYKNAWDNFIGSGSLELSYARNPEYDKNNIGNVLLQQQCKNIKNRLNKLGITEMVS